MRKTNKVIYAIAIAAAITMIAFNIADAESVLIGGFGGTSSTAIQSPLMTSISVSLTSPEVPAVPTQGFSQIDNPLWGSTALDVAAPTIAGGDDLSNLAIRQGGTIPAWTLVLQVTNNGTADLLLDKIHFLTKKDANNAGPPSGTLTYTSGDLSDATGANTTFSIPNGSNIPFDIALDGFLTDTTLAPGESATFTWAHDAPQNPAGNTSLRVDNFAISGAFANQIVLSANTVATNAAPGTLVGSLLGPAGADAFVLTNAPAGGSNADNGKFQITDGTNLRTRVWMSQYSNEIAISAVSSGVALVTNSLDVVVTAATSVVFRVSAEVSSFAADGDVIGTMTVDNDAGATFSIISGRTDLFTMDGNDNLLVTNAASWRTVGSTNFVTIRATRGALSSDLTIGAEIISGVPEASVFRFR